MTNLDDLYLEHFGTPRHSGRYPWGSGDNPYQHEDTFLSKVYELRSQGLSESDIAKGFGMSTGQFRKEVSAKTNELRNYQYKHAVDLKDHGYSNTKIAEMLGVSEGTVRNLLKGETVKRANRAEDTSEILKKYIESQPLKAIDVGPGTELYLNTTDHNLKNAIKLLEDQGYEKKYIQVEQLGTNGQKTTVTVLAAPGVNYNDIYENRFDIKNVSSKVINPDGTIAQIEPVKPKSIDSKRIYIRYAEDGGKEKDGTIELRRGVNDISLGNNRYAQVRVAVDDAYYLKGMALYSDDIPKGYDVVFNTNKSIGTDKSKVFKELKDDPENPFGASIKGEDQLIRAQKYYIDENGKKQLSPINIVNEEGDWSRWSKTLSSQFLSKQTTKLAKQQLDLDYKYKLEDLQQIDSVTNPVIKKKLLDSFASDCDASAEDLKAAAIPRQATKVILPFTDLRDNEVYDPDLPEGTVVNLVRHPHGGTFEIPTLTVRNKGTSASKIIGNATDAIGINSKVAGILSGADFDGDTVLVLPINDKIKIKTTPQLTGLKDFDPGIYEIKDENNPRYYVKPATKHNEMGKISNLITDMTIKGATQDELARAVRHSMVVIDSEKHHYDYRQSYIDNGIQELKNIYQKSAEDSSGASTIISRASSEVRVPERKVQNYISKYEIYVDKDGTVKSKGNVDPKTGKLIFPETGKVRQYVNVKEPVVEKKLNKKTGLMEDKVTMRTVKKTVYEDKRTGDYLYSTVDSNGKKIKVKANKNDILEEKVTDKVSRMSTVDDAYKLTSGGSKENFGTQMEGIYADYANKMKALGNRARKDYIDTPKLKYSPEANKKYKKAVDTLNAKLKLALQNAPKEREAQLLANSIISLKLKDNPDLKNDKEHYKKEKGRALNKARERVGAKKEYIDISDYEWEAIQAGAISESKLEKILNNTKLESIQKRATPKKVSYTNTDIQLAKSMVNAGYTTADIAERLGLSPSTISRMIN